MPRLQKNLKTKRRNSIGKKSSFACPVPFIECTRDSVQAPSFDEGGVRMYCSNSSCTNSLQPIHPECFKSLEKAIAKTLHTTGSARRWTEDQLYQNIWTKKGMNLVSRKLNCSCGKGILDPRKDFRLLEAPLPKNGAPADLNKSGSKKKHCGKQILSVSGRKYNSQKNHSLEVDDYLSKYSDEEKENVSPKYDSKPHSNKEKSKTTEKSPLSMQSDQIDDLTSGQSPALSDFKDSSVQKPKKDQVSYPELQVVDELSKRLGANVLQIPESIALQNIYAFSDRLKRPGRIRPELHPQHVSNLTPEQRMKPIDRSHEKRHWFLYNLSKKESPE